MGLTKFQVALSSVTVTGSLLSCLGTAAIIIFFIIRVTHSTTKVHFRHKLIMNLAIADFVNSACNTVSGLRILATQSPLQPGLACTVNGLITQVTVQATDCAVLAIAVVTVYSVVNVNRLLRSRDDHHRLVIGTCAATWVLPGITGAIALGMDWYTPVSGNWCWIQASPTYLRYVLTHGWRFLFILLEIALYAYLLLHTIRMSKVRHRYACAGCRENVINPSTSSYSSMPCTYEECKGHRYSSCQMCEDPHPKSQADLSTTDQASTGAINCITTSEVSKIMLLNAYPIGYILLWIPGIVNRVVEAMGHSSQVLQLLQASTQFVGLANALTYGIQTSRIRS